MSLSHHSLCRKGGRRKEEKFKMGNSQQISTTANASGRKMTPDSSGFYKDNINRGTSKWSFRDEMCRPACKQPVSKGDIVTHA